nr:glucose-induced degradation protein 4 like [Quercus suber]
MPETTAVPSPPVDGLTSRASFASCPPEEEREGNAQWENRGNPDGPSSAAHEVAEDEHVTIQQPTPEPDALVQSGELPAGSKKGQAEEEAALIAESASDAGSPDTSVPQNESEARLAQSMSTAAISSEAPHPMYMSYPRSLERVPARTTSSFLRPGSKFRGTQQSDRQIYDVQVEIKDVDMAESFLCGYLRIQGLTDDHPTLTTFFEGEIIGPKHLFKTTHPSWGSSEKVDLQHWARFPAWRPLAKSAKSPNFSLKNYQQREHLFMRWKEYFLVPDHRVKTITGASFEGFYYICFNQCSGTVSGIYFHAKSEKYQQLELQHVDDMGCMPSVQFR